MEGAQIQEALVIRGTVQPGRRKGLGSWLPERSVGWQDLKRESGRLKIRWRWVLLLALALLLVMGEFGPAASAIAGLP